MDAQSLIHRIASIVGLDKQVNLAGDVYGKLEDGTSVATDSFQVGNVLYVLNESGTKALAPDAEHKIYLPTENGSKLYTIITKDGIITQMDLMPNPGKQLEMKKEELAMGPNDTKVNPEMIEGEKPEIDKEIDTEKITMQEDVKSMMDAMAAEIKQLRDDIANIYSKMEPKKEEEMESEVEMKMDSYNEEAKVKDILKGGVGVGGQGKPNDGGPSKYNMSAQKKFTGAPAAEAKPLEGLLKSNKVENAMSRVFSKMANSKI
jgi:hypothetical protein